MYSAKEAAEITGLSTAALRYYEKEKLIPQITRTDQKYRQYTDTDIEWIKMVQCMRMANIPIRSIKQYVSLLIQGGKTLEQRYSMVQNHIHDIENQMRNLQNALTLTQKKLAFYDELLQTTTAPDLTCLEEWDLFKSKGES